jgi:protein TonB
MNAAAMPWPDVRRPALPWAGLGASLAAHGVAVVVLGIFWQAPAWRVPPEPMILDVRIDVPIQPPAHQDRPIPAHVSAPALALIEPSLAPARPASELAPPLSGPEPRSQPPLPPPQTLARVAPRESPSVAVIPIATSRLEPVASAQVAAATPAPSIAAPATSMPAPARVSPTTASIPSAAAVAAEAERRWHLVLLDRLRDMKRYPMAARRLGQEGVVVVEARIAPDGRLESALVKHGSGFTLLDNDALRLMEIAAEAARAQLKPERSTWIQVPITYRLEQ